MYIPRLAESVLIRLSGEYPVVAVTGPRQSGKTTLVRSAFPDKPYVSLEDLDVRALAREDPRGFLDSYPEGAILDEVQNTPDLFSYLQTRVDQKERSGLFVLTGSRQFDLLSGITQTLAGRVALLSLLPLSQAELGKGGLDPGPLGEFLFRGLYPPIFSRKADPSIWYGNYVRTYIERDVRQILNIRDLSSFHRFVKICAGRTGQLVNLSALANDCGLSHNTAKAWLSVLEASGLLFFLAPHHQNFNKRLLKTPKLFFTDTGLVSWLLGIESPEQIGTHPQFGALFETFVVGEFLKSRLNRALEPRLSFWQDRTGHEVDLILERGDKVLPVEVKAGKTVVPDYFRGLDFWGTMTGRKEEGWIVYGGEEPRIKGRWRVVPWKGLGESLNPE
jgi:predicted AAA+ superfamily ATPase